MRVRLVARCNGPWEIRTLRIMEGQVPSGLIFDGEEFSGTPNVGGNWLLQIKVIDPTCNGIVYEDKDVWLRFGIKGDREIRF